MGPILASMLAGIGSSAASTGMNIGTWALNNWYNQPKKQVQRMKEAGLNPALMYGSGGGGFGQSPSIPVSQVNQPNPAQYSQLKLDQQNTNLIKEQIELTKAKTLVETVNAANISEGTTKLKIENFINSQLAGMTIQGKALENQGLALQHQKTMQDIIQSKQNIKFEERKIIDNELNSASQRAKTYQEIKNLETSGRILLNEEVYSKFKSRMAERNININDPQWSRSLGAIINWLQKEYKTTDKAEKVTKNLINNMGKDYWWNSIMTGLKSFKK